MKHPLVSSCGGGRCPQLGSLLHGREITLQPLQALLPMRSFPRCQWERQVHTMRGLEYRHKDIPQQLCHGHANCLCTHSQLAMNLVRTLQTLLADRQEQAVSVLLRSPQHLLVPWTPIAESRKPLQHGPDPQAPLLSPTAMEAAAGSFQQPESHGLPPLALGARVRNPNNNKKNHI